MSISHLNRLSADRTKDRRVSVSSVLAPYRLTIERVDMATIEKGNANESMPRRKCGIIKNFLIFNCAKSLINLITAEMEEGDQLITVQLRLNYDFFR